MQTFLPYASYKESAKVLDNKRLGKQRVECYQILTAIYFHTKWSNHPAVIQWNSYPDALIEYQIAITEEWVARGYEDNTLVKSLAIQPRSSNPQTPHWFGDRAYHISHQSNLVRKDPVHYRKFFQDIRDDMPYIWPGKPDKYLGGLRIPRIKTDLFVRMEQIFSLLQEDTKAILLRDLSKLISLPLTESEINTISGALRIIKRLTD